SRTWSEPSSAVEWTATASIPSSCSARITRTAISPRFATRTRANIALDRGPHGERLELEEELPELDGLRVLGVDGTHDSLDVRLHLVHELHRLEDAEGLSRRHDVADFDEWGRTRLTRT